MMTQAAIRDGEGLAATADWGKDIAVEIADGKPFKMYTRRPHRLAQLLELGRRWGDRPHIVQGDRVLTFNDLLRLAPAKAADLARRGVKSGDRVFLMAFNSPDYVINYWAVLLAGAVPTLVNAWWSEVEVSDAVASMKPALILADTKASARIPANAATAPWGNDDIMIGETPDHAPDQGDENEPGVIIFTSGTSGKPKGVVLSHRSLLANLQMLLHMTKRLPQQLTETSADIALHTGPLFHIGGAQAMLRAVTVGNTLIMPRGRFDAGETLDLIEAWKVNRWSAVPTMISRVLEHPDLASRNLTSLKAVTLGGAPCIPNCSNAFAQVFRARMRGSPRATGCRKTAARRPPLRMGIPSTGRARAGGPCRLQNSKLSSGRACRMARSSSAHPRK
jgi:acyl-CoA synthetase (AMP-forming)/AMP-acid ligase II